MVFLVRLHVVLGLVRGLLRFAWADVLRGDRWLLKLTVL